MKVEFLHNSRTVLLRIEGQGYKSDCELTNAEATALLKQFTDVMQHRIERELNIPYEAKKLLRREAEGK